MMATLEAEFPAWQLVGCFDVFHLEGSSGRQRRGCSHEDALRKLAKTFAVDYRELSEQYVSIFATAQALHKKGGLDNRTAWSQAVLHVEARVDSRKKYPTSALKKAGPFNQIMPRFCFF